MQGDVALQARSSDQGMGALTREDFEPALLALIGDWLGAAPMPVVACGMVGARTGWAEAEYRAVPCSPLDARRATRPAVRDARLQVHILPGLSQNDPPDVMRGEETQIQGFLAANPGFCGALCLPGTHCKWVRIAQDRVLGFHTFMTGEVYALLAQKSVLRLTIDDAAPDMAQFLAAAAQALADPDTVASGLFSLRAAALLGKLSASEAAGRLSGLLIGAELAASRTLWQNQPVVIIGAPQLAGFYMRALSQAGADASQQDGGELVVAGLAAAAKALTGTT